MLLLRLRSLKPLLLLPHHSETLNPNVFPHLRLLSSSSSSSSSSSNPNPNPNNNNNAAAEEWTEEIHYYDESNTLITSSFAARPATSASTTTSPSPSLAASKLTQLALRFQWGPDLHSHLNSLPFTPDPVSLSLSLSSLSSHPSPSLSLFLWAHSQPWYSPPSDPSFSLVLSHLFSTSQFHLIHSLFLSDLLPNSSSLPDSANLALRLLSAASQLEPAFSCFKKLKDSHFHQFTSSTYDSLITMFLTKGLPYKAFEIYESMMDSGLDLDAATYELMVPALAKTGRIDGALKMFDELKRIKKDARVGFGVYAALVDCLGKAGRLDASLGVYREMLGVGYRPSLIMYASKIESLVKAGKLDAGKGVWDEMKGSGFRPNFGLYTMVVEAFARSGRRDVAMEVFGEMEKAGFLPTPSTYSCLIEMHSGAGEVDAAMRLYNSMSNAGFRLGMSVYTSLLSVLAGKKLLDLAAKVLLEMKSNGFVVDVNASDVLMIYIREGSTDLALRWLRFMGSAGIRTNNFIVRQLFESCMKAGLYDSARPLLETYVGSAAKVDLVLYTSILAHLVRCQDEKNERAIMDIMSVTKHKAHEFMCGLFTGPEQRKTPVLSFVREFFQGLDYDVEESAAKYFVNVLLNYLVLMGQMNRARCVWKVAYENKLFPKAIVFDQHIAWSLDVRNLSVGAALVAVIHTLHRFRKRMLYYGVVPRRIKLVTGPTLKMVVAQVLASVESPFEVSKVVLRAPGDSVLEWFKKPIVQQLLLNEIPTKGDVLMHKLNVMFPSSAPEVRSLSPLKPPSLSKVMY